MVPIIGLREPPKLKIGIHNSVYIPLVPFMLLCLIDEHVSGSQKLGAIVRYRAASIMLYFLSLSSVPVIAPYGNFGDVLYLNKLFFIEITVTDVLCSICFALW